MKRTSVIAGLLGTAAILLWCFPLFHVIPLDRARAESQQKTFDAEAFAETLWQEQLAPSLEQASDATDVLAAIRDNPQRARDEFGQSIGLSRSYTFFLQGTGTITSVETSGVHISVSGAIDRDTLHADPEIVLRTGPVFGNTVRDAIGLVKASDFPNSQHFNKVSTALNQLVETQVIPQLKEGAKAGRQIQFVGCVVVASERTDLNPLQVIPLKIAFQ